MLRRKNRLMRKGRVEEASALAQRIGKEITRRTKTQLSTIQHVDSRAIWECVRRLMARSNKITVSQALMLSLLMTIIVKYQHITVTLPHHSNKRQQI